MESPEHSQTTTIQKNSEATILDQSQLQRLVAIDQPVTLKIKFNWGWFKSLVSDINKPDGPPSTSSNTSRSPKSSSSTIPPPQTMSLVPVPFTWSTSTQTTNTAAEKSLLWPRSGFARSTPTGLASSKPPPKGQSAVMTWTGDVGASMWDFVCTDEQHMPISKFAARLWGMKKIGQIELMSPLSHEEVLRNEMLITVMTLAYCMVVRIFSLLGSIFGDPGHDKKYKPKPLPVDNGRASSDSIPQLSTAVTDGQADLTHQQPHSDPYVETATGTANQSAVK